MGWRGWDCLGRQQGDSGLLDLAQLEGRERLETGSKGSWGFEAPGMLPWTGSVLMKNSNLPRKAIPWTQLPCPEGLSGVLTTTDVGGCAGTEGKRGQTPVSAPEVSRRPVLRALVLSLFHVDSVLALPSPSFLFSFPLFVVFGVCRVWRMSRGQGVTPALINLRRSRWRRGPMSHGILDLIDLQCGLGPVTTPSEL